MAKTEVEKVQGKIDGFLKGYTDKKFFSMHSAEADKEKAKRKIGERWTDSEGVIWEQADGYVIKNADAHMMRSQNEVCKKCKLYPEGHASKQIHMRTGMCLNCLIEFETELKATGKFEEYEKNKMKENIRSFIKDTEQQVKEFFETVDSGVNIVTVANESLASIDYEKWEHGEGDKEEQKRLARETLRMMHEDFEKSFGEKVHTELTENKNVGEIVG